MRYQRRRKGQMVQPFHGDVSEHIHSQEAASMSPPSDRGNTMLSSTVLIIDLYIHTLNKVMLTARFSYGYSCRRALDQGVPDLSSPAESGS